MKRINWEAKSDFQYIENYKILQAAFTKQRVQKRVDVDRLIRAKYQDNLEFCQWLKAFVEHASSEPRDDYDPVARRMIGKGGTKLDEMFLPRGTKKATGTGSTAGGSSRSVARASSGASVSSSRSVSSNYTSTSRRSAAGAPLRDVNSRSSVLKMKNAVSSASSQQIEKFEMQNAQLKRKNAENELILENIEKERDFYFDKLRGIEVMLQVHEETGAETGEHSDPDAVIQRIFKVLYAKIEDNIIVTDDGELLQDMAEGVEDLLNDSNISMLSSDALEVGE